jgi:hypothetical protein
VVDTEAGVKQLLHFPVFRRGNFLAITSKARVARRIEVLVDAFRESHLAQLFRSTDSFFPSVHEYHDLVTFSNEIRHLWNSQQVAATRQSD